MGLQWYRGLVIPLTYYPGMDDPKNTNRLHTISPSVPPANDGILPADHGIPVPPPSPDKSKMLPPPTPSTKGKEKEMDRSTIGGLLMDLAEDGSGDGTRTPAEKDATSTLPAPTDKEAGGTPPVHTKKDTCTTPPAPTEKEAGTTPEQPTDSQQKGTPKPHRPATPSSESSSSDNNNSTEDEEYVSCFVQWLGLNLNCKRILKDKMKMLAHHRRKMGNKDCYAFGVTGIFRGSYRMVQSILIWIFNPESRIITRISILDLPSRVVHQLVISPLPDLRLNR